MNRIIRITAMFLVFGILAVSYTNPKTEKTIENLKAAITGESNASATYLAFSAKAADEGYPNIAKMFASASAAEAIHVKNHKAVLVKLGVEAFTPAIETPKVSTTTDNLQAAIDGETHEYTVMYPGFIAVANTENCTDALTTFRWASDAEATHAKLYAQALSILKTTESDKTAASIWYICPRCGDLFITIEGLNGCPLCGTRPASFLKF